MELVTILAQATFETLIMVLGSVCLGGAVGIPLGIILFILSSQGLSPCQKLYEPLSFLVNTLRSTPFVIVSVLLIPLTRLIMGTSIGPQAMIIPLGICAILLIARATEESLAQQPRTLHDLGLSLGINNKQIIFRILMPEAFPSLVASITTIIINIIGFSAMAGTLGGGGLGDLAIRYGYQRYDMVFMVMIVLILVVLVQIVQMIGKRLSEKLRH
jgi:D-methionine transport system permease protein